MSADLPDRFYRGPALRSWQVQALDSWESNERRGVVEAITGTGKSLLGVRAIRDVVALGGKALVLVPTRALLEQWFELLQRNLVGVTIGRVAEGLNDRFYDKDVLVATVQSASRSPIQPVSLGLLVADEVHRYGSAQFSKALHETFEWRLGLTATLERLDDGVDRVLRPYFSGSVYSYGYEEANRDDVVAPFHLLLAGVEFSPHERQRFKAATERASESSLELRERYGYSGSWSEFFYEVQFTLQDERYDDEYWKCQNYMRAFSERRTLMAEAQAKESFIGHLAPMLVDRTGILLFSETRDSARRLAYIVNRYVPTWPLTSDDSHQDRERVLKQFKAGQVGALCTPRILDEGVDVPDANLAVIVSASSTRRQMIQRMGRVVRLKSSGGAAGIVFVYVKDTPEDPATGGHEAFLDSVMPFARSTTTIDAKDSESIPAWMVHSLDLGRLEPHLPDVGTRSAAHSPEQDANGRDDDQVADEVSETTFDGAGMAPLPPFGGEVVPSKQDVEVAWLQGGPYVLKADGDISPRAGGSSLSESIGGMASERVQTRWRAVRPGGGRFKVGRTGIVVTLVGGEPTYVMTLAPDEWFPGGIASSSERFG